jgi:hypothetical protein
MSDTAGERLANSYTAVWFLLSHHTSYAMLLAPVAVAAIAVEFLAHIVLHMHQHRTRNERKMGPSHGIHDTTTHQGRVQHSSSAERMSGVFHTTCPQALAPT